MSVKVAASQFKSIKEKKDLNINKAIDIAQQASKENVNIFLLQELFQTEYFCCLLYTSPSPRDLSTSRMPSSA